MAALRRNLQLHLPARSRAALASCHGQRCLLCEPIWPGAAGYQLSQKQVQCCWLSCSVAWAPFPQDSQGLSHQSPPPGHGQWPAGLSGCASLYPDGPHLCSVAWTPLSSTLGASLSSRTPPARVYQASSAGKPLPLWGLVTGPALTTARPSPVRKPHRKCMKSGGKVTSWRK